MSMRMVPDDPSSLIPLTEMNVSRLLCEWLLGSDVALKVWVFVDPGNGQPTPSLYDLWATGKPVDLRSAFNSVTFRWSDLLKSFSWTLSSMCQTAYV